MKAGKYYISQIVSQKRCGCYKKEGYVITKDGKIIANCNSFEDGERKIKAL